MKGIILKKNICIGVLKRALEEAEMSECSFRLGCVVFKGSRIFASGHNKIRSSRIDNRHKLFKNALHAEQDAILKVSDWSTLKGTSLLVVKISKKHGYLSMAKPCEMCQTLINYVGIKNVYYSNEHGEIIRIKSA